MNIDLDYLFLNILLLGVFAYNGYRVSSEGNFWKHAFWCIIIFSFVQGTRYMRGNDYLGYAHTFEIADKAKTNLTFAYINQFLALLGFSKYSCFLAYAFVFSLCGMSFLKNFEKYAQWTFPLFILGFMMNQEYMIRQMFSYSFFFLYLNNLFKIETPLVPNINTNNKHLFLCTLWGGLCFAIHSANAINIFVFTLFFIFVKKPIHYFITIPIYLSSVYVLPEIINYNWIEVLVTAFSDQNEMVSRYAENASLWFTEKAIDDIYTRNYYVQLFESIGTSALLFLGYKTISLRSKELTQIQIDDEDIDDKYIDNEDIEKQYETIYETEFEHKEKLFDGKTMTVFFNTVFIGVCIVSVFREIELLNRIGDVMRLMWCMVLAFVMYSRQSLTDLYKFRIVYLFLLWYGYEYLKYLFFRGNMTLFIWDAPITVSFF